MDSLFNENLLDDLDLQFQGFLFLSLAMPGPNCRVWNLMDRVKAWAQAVDWLHMNPPI